MEFVKALHARMLIMVNFTGWISIMQLNEINATLFVDAKMGVAVFPLRSGCGEK